MQLSGHLVDGFEHSQAMLLALYNVVAEHCHAHGVA